MCHINSHKSNGSIKHHRKVSGKFLTSLRPLMILKWRSQRDNYKTASYTINWENLFFSPRPQFLLADSGSPRDSRLAFERLQLPQRHARTRARFSSSHNPSLPHSSRTTLAEDSDYCDEAPGATGNRKRANYRRRIGKRVRARDG